MGRRINVLAFFLLAIVTGCNVVDSSNNKSEESNKVLENVWEYVQTTDMPQDEEWKSAWLNGKVEEIKMTDDIDSYQHVEEKFHNDTVFLVTPLFKTERIAYPRIVVDPQTKEVIAELPGE